MRVVQAPGPIAVPVWQPHAERAAQPSRWMRATRFVDGRYFASSSGSTLVATAGSSAGWRSFLPGRDGRRSCHHSAEAGGLSAADGAPEHSVAGPSGRSMRALVKNWKRSTRWRIAIIEIGRPSLRVHDLSHIYLSLAFLAVQRQRGTV
jgi:hypothetical protein